ncbi:MAG: MarR family transcriptional regulator [Marinoscillum sp.]|uniref:MarR family winged helix-turn-helix transcriptional regulator n=1 Tax=Marinoscillum sp. TaxID=2024838 RepID=UPI0032FCB26A
MKIEDEIKGEDFVSVQHKLRVNLNFTYLWTQDQLQHFFAGYGLTAQQYNVLRILRGAFPHSYTTSQILDRMLEKNAGVSRLVDRLLKKELVIKEVSAKDKRLVDVTISYKGHALCERMDEEMKQVDSIYNNLDLEEMDQLNHLLDKLRG